MRWSHVSDDDSQRQAVKSNDFLCIGELKLTSAAQKQSTGLVAWSAMIR